MADPRSEPSMEEILASIKRIIADDPALPSAAPRPAQATARAAPAARAAPEPIAWPRRSAEEIPDSVLELTDRMPESPPPRPVVQPVQPIQPPPRVPTEAAPPPPTTAPARPAPEPMPRPPAQGLRTGEPEAAQAARPVPRDLLPRNPAPRPGSGDVTLEALVRSMLQPMLADWLDKNLPDIVERAVQAEIRRLSDRDG